LYAAQEVVVAITIPLLAYRVCEELYQMPDVGVLGPVTTAEEALVLARCCVAPILVSDALMAQALAPHLTSLGGRQIRVRLQDGAAHEDDRRGPPSINLALPTWTARLRALVCEELPSAPMADDHERRQRAAGYLGALLDEGVARDHPAARDAETDLPTGAAFGVATANLAQVGEPTLLLFVDLSAVVASGAKQRAWLAEAGKRLRHMLRQGDLVFRLDVALYAILAPCPRPEYAPVLRQRLRWMLCGADFIAPECILTGDAYWTGETTPAQTASTAWHALQHARGGHAPCASR
jgi:hypothetical protein